jgi:demethylmenaquinone methyltransferase/2-methoxy-6-polyprenyl-1,4-benzoquinol methylase
MSATKQSQSGAISSKDDVQGMFDTIVPRYDLMNHVMTTGMDFRWRRLVANLAKTTESGPSDFVVDVACGTGDVAFEIEKVGVPLVTGLDFSAGMIAQAKKKAEKRKSEVFFIEGDAMNMPFEDGAASAATISFGMRNLPDYAAGVQEMARIVRPGGKVICLELTPYDRPFLKVPFGFYFNQVVPAVGWVLTRQYKAYKYLPESVRNFPNADEMVAIFRDAGLVDVKYTMHGFGTVALHVGTKPL